MKYEDIKPGMVLLEEVKATHDLTQLAKCYSIILVKNKDLVRLLEVFEVKDKWLCKPRIVYEKNWDTKGWWRSRRVNKVMLFDSLFQPH